MAREHLLVVGWGGGGIEKSFGASIKKMCCCCCCCLIKIVRGHSNSLKSKEPSPFL